MRISLDSSYQNLIKQKGFKLDPNQLQLIKILDNYKTTLENHYQRSIFKKLISFYNKPKLNAQGIYIHGEVGRGKSMLMNLFFNTLEIQNKKRIHFHEFMRDFHNKLHSYQNLNNGSINKSDYVVKLAKEIASEFAILGLDELQVNNIADAMIVGRLFSTLLENGTFILFTSNRPPEDLFKDGLQRERFVPFIDLVKEKLTVFKLDSPEDYRLTKSDDLKRSYIYPIDKSTKAEIELMKESLIGSHPLQKMELEIGKNRVLKIKRVYNNIAFFTFDELCTTYLGSIDYIKIAQTFETIVIEKIPQLGQHNYNEALRFITLIDCLYEFGRKLICTSDVSIDQIYEEGKNKFEFQRTISRLKEMQSIEYNKNIML